MSFAAQKLHENIEGDINNIVRVSVSVDGTWQKRHGFNSLHGVVFVISIDHGLVLDYVVKTLVCFECKKIKMPQQNGKNVMLQIAQSTTMVVRGQWRRKQLWKCLPDPLRNINYFVMFLLVRVIPVLLGLLLMQ